MKREVLLGLLSLSSVLTNNPVHALKNDHKLSFDTYNLVESCVLSDNFKLKIFESDLDALFVDKKSRFTYRGKIVVKILKGNVGEIYFQSSDGKILPILSSREDAVLFENNALSPDTTDKNWNSYVVRECYITTPENQEVCEILRKEIKKPIQGVWLDINKSSHKIATLTFVDSFNPSLKLPVVTSGNSGSGNDSINYTSKGVHIINLTLTSCE